MKKLKETTKKKKELSPVKVTGFKAFDKDFKCNGFQYEPGKEYVHDGDIKLCRTGFHFCERPFDIFSYYSPATSRFAPVEGEEVSDETEEDSKRVAKKLKIGIELSLHSLIEAGIKFIFEKADFNKATETNKEEKKGASNSGDYGAASNSGYYGAASNSGTRGAASNSGYYGAASNSGKEGIALAAGIEGRAKGSLGTWIVVSEWEYTDEWHRIDVQSVKVDGKVIKENTFYMLQKGKFVEVKE